MGNQALNIIDTHTHLPGYSFGSTPRSADELRAEFSGDGVSQSWIMTTDGLIGEPEKSNDILAETMREDLDFFVPFCTVSPHSGAEQALAELVRCHTDLGMKGLKFHPWLQSFSLTHPAVQPVMGKAGELGMPVLFHDGTPPYSTPLQIAAAAGRTPDTNVILGHSGLDDLYRDAILACNRNDNIWLCLCSLSSGYIREVIRQCPADRLLFGSDGGFGAGLVRDAVEKIYAACGDDSILEAIFYHNPRRLLE